MHKIALFGAGKIGSAITAMLSKAGDYDILVCDADEKNAQTVAQQWPRAKGAKLDLKNEPSVRKLLADRQAVLSALPFHCNPDVALIAAHAGVHYLDLTEDVAVTQAVANIAKNAKSAFLPQCGLAPGFISIAAQALAEGFEQVSTVKMRVGALPIFPSNMLKYNLTWSTEGVINEYANLCEAIVDGKLTHTLALEGHETFSLDGVTYEAFNTSGGLGSMCQTLLGKVAQLDYKSIRYPGHRDLMYFLIREMGFHNNRTELKKILERSIPWTAQDKVLILVEVQGVANGKLTQKSYVSTVYNQKVEGAHFGAIQLTTASGICTPLDLLLTGKLPRTQGVIRLEEIPLNQFLSNRFGTTYREATPTHF